MIGNFDDCKTRCSGCTACMSICPKRCITMKADYEGFLYPEVNKAQCIKCGLCERVCPVNHPVENKSWRRKVYAFRSKDKDGLIQGTSGGMFSAVCTYIVKNNGVVCAASFDENYNVCHSFLERDEILRGGVHTELQRFQICAK